MKPIADGTRIRIRRKTSRASSTGFLKETSRLLGELSPPEIGRARQILLDCYHRRGRVYTMGNGGSASTAQHFACDLAKYVIPAGARPFDTRCLTDNAPLYTAWANDAAREDVFANQMRGLLMAEDVVIAISVHGGSGFSADLVRGARYARETGARTIALVGFDGGILHRECDCSVLVPVESTPANRGSPFGGRAPADGPLEGGSRRGASAWALIFCASATPRMTLSMFVEGFPAENSKSETHEWMESGGGPAANAAYLASAWGARSAFAGLVRGRHLRRRVRREFQSAGTDVSLLETRPGHATPVSMILINKQNGSRTIVNRKAPGAPFRPEAGALAAMKPTALLFDGHELEASCAALTAFPERRLDS